MGVRGTLISVVTPVYMNAETVEGLHRRMGAALQGLGELQFVFVDDACPG